MFIWNRGDLNEEQEKAIYEENSVLLVACPGSGKTRTLTYKIAYELSRLESEKQFIIAITYTNAAADEIKERVELLGVDTKQLWIGTIHSFCLEWILRPYSLYLDELKLGFTILNSHESEELITDLCKPYENPRITYWDCGFIAKPDNYYLTSLDANKHSSIKAILCEYFKTLRTRNHIDFEQILHYSYKILKNKSIVNSILSNLFPFILIDEYQDTKEIQYHIISSILNANKGISRTLIVGDPNQSIYDSLGGFPMEKSVLESLLGFRLSEYSLSNNYRSSEKIINYFDFYKTYNNLITPFGVNKDYKSIITFDNKVTKTELLDEIVRLILFNVNDKGISPNEICIAAPQWVHLASLTRNLMAKLPDYSFDGTGMTPFSRDIDNFWCKLSRIVLTEPSPELYIKRLRWAKEVLDELNYMGADIPNITPKIFLKICNSININETEGLSYLRVFFDEIFIRISVEMRAFQTLTEHYDSFFSSSESRINRLAQEGCEFIATTDNFKKVFKQKNGIKISTMHGIKGMEFDAVIGFGLLNGWIPHFSDKNGDSNSKKMLYVLSSRAKKNLHLISETGRNVNGWSSDERQPTFHLTNYEYDYDE